MPPFRTMTLLLVHCESAHENSLGKTHEHMIAIIYTNIIKTIGRKKIQFGSMREFNQWKELEEESTYATYVRQQKANHPTTSEGMKH